MKRKYKHILECSSGDIIAEDIYDRHGFFIIGKNTEANDYVLKKLRDMKIQTVCIYELPEISKNKKNDDPSFKEFKKSYRENIFMMKKILNDLAVGNRPDFDKINILTGSIYNKITHNSFLFECINEVKSVDEYTYYHSVNVALYGMLIAKWIGLQKQDIKDIIYAGLLHDIGKVKIPNNIIKKNDKLTKEEFEEVKKHTMYGYEISKDIPELSMEIRKSILMHHEREDGGGYPLGVTGNDLHIYTKIIALADVYDALTSQRSYKNRFTPFDTFKEIRNMGYAKFDMRITTTFLENIASYYIGSRVRMNTGEVGVVVYMTAKQIATPVVMVGDDFIDLSQNKYYKISEMIS